MIRIVSNTPNFRATRKYDPNANLPALFRVQETNWAGAWQDITPLFNKDDIAKWLDENGYEPIVTSQRGRQFYTPEKKTAVIAKPPRSPNVLWRLSIDGLGNSPTVRPFRYGCK